MSKQIDLKVNIITIKPTIDDLRKYVEAQHVKLALGSNLTVNDYLKDNSKYKNSNDIIVADLSNMEFNSQNSQTLFDLSKADFSGAIIKNTKFVNCDLTDAVFCDTDLDGAIFQNTTLRNVDFRGAGLASCEFSANDRSYTTKESERFEGIKFSTTHALARQYADIKSELYHTLEQKKLLKEKRKEVQDAYNKVSYRARIFGGTKEKEQYDKLKLQLDKMEKGVFQKEDYIMHPSFKNVFSSHSGKFDPVYKRGSSKAHRDEHTEYVRLNREDVEKYLKLIKDQPGLTLNEFAKDQFIQNTKGSITHARYVADCASGVRLDNELIRLDLSGLDFTGAKINGVSFAGSNLEKCNFTLSDISNSTFEGAILSSAVFNKTVARDANFFNTNIANAEITESDFKRAFMPRSDASDAQIKTSNFDYADIKKGKWDKIKIEDSTFHEADMEGISLAAADIRRVKAQHAILNNAILEGCEFIESDFSKSFMQGVNATKAHFTNSILTHIEANAINLSEAELDEFTKLDGANLENAILTKINAERASFVGANMDKVQAGFANLAGANLESVVARFADLDGAILNEVKASKIDMTGAKLNNAQARGAKFQGAMMEGLEAEKTDFTNSDFTEADLQNCNLKQAILDQVNMEKAKINANSNFVEAQIEEAKGQLINHDHDGKEIGTKTIQDQKILSEQIEKAKEMPLYKKIIGNSLNFIVRGGAKIKNLLQNVGSSVTKYGKYLGVAAGIAAGLAVAASVVVTAGLSLPVAVAVGGACSIVGGVVGRVAAHYGAKLSMGSVVGGVFAASITGNPSAIVAGVALGEVANAALKKTTGVEMGAGTAIGVTLALATGGVALAPILAGSLVGVSTDVIVEKATGKSLLDWAKDGYKGLINLCEKGAEKYNSSPEIKALVQEASKCQGTFEEKLAQLQGSIEKHSVESKEDNRLRDYRIIHSVQQRENTLDKKFKLSDFKPEIPISNNISMKQGVRNSIQPF